MSTCKNCQKSGLFLSINDNGLCKSCAPLIETMIMNNIHYIRDELPLIDRSVVPHTFMGNIAAIEESYAYLLECEQKGIRSLNNPSVKESIEIFNSSKDALIAELFEHARYDVDMKVYHLKTQKAKINRYEKFLLDLEIATEKLQDKHALDDTKKIVKKSIQLVEKGTVNKSAK